LKASSTRAESPSETEEAAPSRRLKGLTTDNAYTGPQKGNREQPQIRFKETDPLKHSILGLRKLRQVFFEMSLHVIPESQAEVGNAAIARRNKSVVTDRCMDA